MYYVIVVAVAIVLWNIVTFSLYAIDKKKAKNKKWRIKERTLIGVAFLMGGPGAMIGMSVLRHKTQHMQFKVLVPLATIFNIVIIVASLILTGVVGG